ncbi:FHA domain-containing protein [Desulfofalx alkaliphila]|uniref:FHA domain-containing protein n=1 Tax=Desulfofalx alkaliphila TaxID=105483 RepID=UPI0004E23322|nr:FHA domain-containing protein [Desulfofalx alkaliphila]
MLGIVLLALRLLFLGLFYLFLLKLVIMVVGDLRKAPAAHSQKGGHIIIPKEIKGGDGATLVVVASENDMIKPGFKIYLGDSTRLGRSAKNDVSIVDDFVSTEHAAIKLKDGQYWLEDMGSLNGTYLNEKRLTRPAVLANGDRVRLGGVSFEFVRWAHEVESNN